MLIRCKARKVQLNGRTHYIALPPLWLEQFHVEKGQLLVPVIAEDGSLMFKVPIEEVPA